MPKVFSTYALASVRAFLYGLLCFRMWAIRMTKGVVADTLLLCLLGWKMGFEPTTCCRL